MTPDDAILDYETRSALNLKKVGAYKYFEHASTSVIIASYKLPGDLGISRWLPGDPPPTRLISHVADGKRVVAHNAQFERGAWNKLWRREWPWLPVLRIEQMSCTMVRGFACNLPGKLEDLLRVLGLPPKDERGASAMKRVTKPKRIEKDGTIVWNEDPELLRQTFDYCDNDVYTEDLLNNTLPELTDDERDLWFIDQEMQDFGVPRDTQFIDRAVELVEYAQERAHDEIFALTGGEVSKTTKVKDLMAWLNARGIHADTMRAGDRQRLIQLSNALQDLEAVEAIELRGTAAKTSTAKYKALQGMICEDGCVHGTTQFMGAQQTHRWAGRLSQDQNYPRVSDDEEAEIVATVVGITRDTSIPIHEAYEAIELIGPPKLANGDKQNGLSTLAWLAKSLRSTIAAKPGELFVGGDFANIEGRMNAWLADEFWKLQAFLDYDNKTGPDLYKLAVARAFNLLVEAVTKPQRQIGKVMELACGYQGGVGAFITMVQTYLLKLEELARGIYETTPSELWDATAAKYEHATDKHELPDWIWTAVKIAVTGWRKANPAIVQSWWDVQDAAIQAVDRPHVPVPIYGGKAHYVCDTHFLYCHLPSGHVIMYAQPHIGVTDEERIWDGTRYIDVDTLWPHEVEALLAAGYKITSRRRRTVLFFGLNNQKRWVRKALYGGYQVENIVQATSRDVMVGAMRRTRAAGYPLSLTVHDELLSRVRVNANNWYMRPADHEERYKCLMMERPVWAPTLPIAVATWSGTVYNK